MLFNKIHHIAIICSNYQKSKDFYTNTLGGIIIKETYRIERDSYKLDIKIADSQIELFSFPNPPKRLSGPEACGLRHLAFAVNSMEDTIKKLRSKNIEVEDIRIDSLTNKKFTFFRDPDELPIEVYEEKL